MAKSLRSKWKRKMRAIKRERYGKKELEKLKMIVENAETLATVQKEQISTQDIEMKTDPAVSSSNGPSKDEPMDVNDNKVCITKNKFPIWMGSHKRKKLLKRNKQINKIKKKEIKKNLKKRK